MSVRDKVISLIANIYNTEDRLITSNDSFENDLGGSELKIVELVMACQEEFGIDIKDYDASNFFTAGDFINFIDSRLVFARSGLFFYQNTEGAFRPIIY